MKKSTAVLIMCMTIIAAADNLFSHCQIPCGIYNDEMRFSMMNEHVETIEKSMNEIIRLSQEKQKNYNQIVRWINNKDIHADYIIDIVVDYFIAQRIKIDDDENVIYAQRRLQMLKFIHNIIVYAMRAKQTVDLDNITKLRRNIEEFKEIYFEE